MAEFEGYNWTCFPAHPTSIPLLDLADQYECIATVTMIQLHKGNLNLQWLLAKDCQTLPNKGHKTATALVRRVSLEKQSAIVSMSQVNCQLTMLNPGMLVDSRCIGYTPA